VAIIITFRIQITIWIVFHVWKYKVLAEVYAVQVFVILGFLFFYLCEVNGLNGGDTVFVRCVSVCVCVSVRSRPANQTSLKWLKLWTSNLTYMFP